MRSCRITRIHLDQSVGQSVSQSISLSISQSVSQSVSRSQWVRGQYLRQSVSQSVSQPVRQSVRQWLNQSDIIATYGLGGNEDVYKAKWSDGGLIETLLYWWYESLCYHSIAKTWSRYCVSDCSGQVYTEFRRCACRFRPTRQDISWYETGKSAHWPYSPVQKCLDGIQKYAIMVITIAANDYCC